MSFIPKIIHQTWKGPPDTIPAQWKASYQQWRTLAAEHGWTYMYWTDEDLNQLIQNDYPWFWDTFQAYPYGIQRADTFRYFVLHKHGGVYSDLDLEPKSNFFRFYELVKTYEVALAQCKRGNGYGSQNITNAFMMSQAGANFWPHVWTYLKQPFKDHAWKAGAARFHYFHVLFTTGPGVVSDAAVSYEGRQNLFLIPPELTQPGEDKDNVFPKDSPEAVLKVLEGSSWHASDAKYWRAIGHCANQIQWVFFALFLICLMAATFFYLRWQALVRLSNEVGPLRLLNEVGSLRLSNGT